MSHSEDMEDSNSTGNLCTNAASSDPRIEADPCPAVDESSGAGVPYPALNSRTVYLYRRSQNYYNTA